jgi:hypothetical protein
MRISGPEAGLILGLAFLVVLCCLGTSALSLLSK